MDNLTCPRCANVINATWTNCPCYITFTNRLTLRYNNSEIVKGEIMVFES